MSSHHCSQIDLLERIHGFVVASESNQLADDHWTDFEELLCESDDACRLYAEYMDISFFLPSILEAMPGKDTVSARAFFPEQEPSPSPLPTFLSTAFPATIGYSSGWSVAYLTATVITGLWLLSMWFTPLSRQEQVATHSLPTVAEREVAAEPLPASVGRITGMVDCKSADPGTTSISAAVRLGEKYELASGLMEIAYDTGAKVILQGPVTYSVEANGGYLAIGKLTGKLEKKAESGKWKAEANEDLSSLSTIHYPLSTPFVIRTPTAIVTDLGTEFGVEVDAQQGCHVETFVGLVEVSATAGGKASRHLTTGEAIRIDAAGGMAQMLARSTHFVRNIVSTYAKLVLEDRPLVYWPLNESPIADWADDRSGHNCVGHLIRGVCFGQKGPIVDGHSRAAKFAGNDYIQTDPFPPSDPTKGFSVEVWARVDGGNGQRTLRSPITYREGRTAPVFNLTGFVLYATEDDRWAFWTGQGASWAKLDGPPVVLGQWVHIVGTFQPTDQDSYGVFMGIKNLYVNGSLAATERQSWKPNSDTTAARIGAGEDASSPVYFFIGRIAEVAVYDRPLSPQRVQAHYQASEVVKTGKQTAIGKEVSK